jgi:hypothetical protein
MTTTAQLRELVVGQLTIQPAPNQYPTAAGMNVFSPRTWATFKGQYPAIFVTTPSEDRESLGRHSAQQFTTTATIKIAARVTVPALANDAGAAQAQVALEALKVQIEQALINNPAITQLIQQIAYVRSEIDVSSEGDQPLAELVMQFGYEFYEGPEDFYPIAGDALDEITVDVDLTNRFDATGTYPNPPFPSEVEPAPRTSGPDGRAEGGLDVQLPQ